jgi:hypothetical protein
LSRGKKKKKLVKKIKQQNRTYGVVIDDARHSNFANRPRTSFVLRKERPPQLTFASEEVAMAALLLLTTKTEKKILITNFLKLQWPNPQPRITGVGLPMGNNLLTRTHARDTHTRNPVRAAIPVPKGVSGFKFTI